MGNNLDIYNSFRILRESIDKTNIEKQEQKKQEAVPYTAQDTLMTNTLQSAKQEFGADFNQIKNPMLYYPADGDITLSGLIPELNDAKFQFRYKVGDGAGCYIWANPYLPISDKTIQVLGKVNGVCKNWRDEISKSEDCKPSNYKDPNDVQNNTQGQASNLSGDEAAAGEDMSGGMGNEQAPAPMNERRFRKGDDIELFRVNRGFRPGDDLD